ncbi:secretory subunit [Sorochytrium milnesiophthora]
MLRYEYSTAESYYFVTVVLALFLLPFSYYTYKTRSAATAAAAATEQIDKDAPSSDRLKARRAQRKALESQRGWSISTIVLVAGWALFAYFVFAIYTSTSVVELWDPYQVLGVEEGAPLSAVRKAYRQLSLTEHPDKVPLDQKTAAEKRFIDISKAYKVLTDSKARENFEKYGDPDGPRSTSFGIGLPKWMMNNKSAVVIGYLGILMAVPALFAKWWYANVKYGDNGVLRGSVETLKANIKDKLTMKQLVDILASADELRDRNAVKRGQNQALMDLSDSVSKAMRKVSQSYEESKLKLDGQVPEYARKNQLLLWAFLNRVQVDDQQLAKEVAYAADIANRLSSTALEQVMQRGNLADVQQMLRFQQCLSQGMTPWDSPLMQLPYLTRDHCAALAKGKVKITSFEDLVSLTPAELRERLPDLDESQANEIIKTVSELPVIMIQSVTFTTEDSGVVAVGSKAGAVVEVALEALQAHVQRLGDEKKARQEERNKDSSPVVMLSGKRAKSRKKDSKKDEDSAQESSTEAAASATARYAQPSYDPCVPYAAEGAKQGFWVVIAGGSQVMNAGLLQYEPRARVRIPIPTPDRAGIYGMTVHIVPTGLMGLEVERAAKFKVYPATAGGGKQRAGARKSDNDAANAVNDEEDEISEDEGLIAQAKRQLKNMQ